MRQVRRSMTLVTVALFVLLRPEMALAQGHTALPEAIDEDVPRSAPADGSGWLYTEGAPGGGRYSPLDDIHRGNVSQLTVAWTYRHGDFKSGGRMPDRFAKGTGFEATPILIEDRLVFSTPFNRVIALDASSGAEVWAFDPEIDRGRRFANMLINRGVAYWEDRHLRGPCSRRVFLGTLDARLLALDPTNGEPCTDFGDGGEVNLLQGIEHLVDSWEYNLTSPPTVVGDKVVVGSSIADLTRRIMPSGAVRAYEARTGDLAWRFNTIPQGDELGSETWENESWRHNGGANVWSTMTADLERGLVFLPVSTAGPDLYGGDRLGANLFSDSIVALDAESGERRWHFQTVHHDLWDYDLAAPPILVTLRREGVDVDAVVQLTKTGLVFVLDRESGTPLYPVEERPVPPSDVPGERAWATQPFPVAPPPLVPHHLEESDLWDADPKHLKACRKKLSKLRNEGIYTPPSERGSILYPGATGGANWSGGAFDPRTGVLYVPTNNLPLMQRLEKLPASNFAKTGGRPMRGGLGGIWWGLTGRGTGLRYSMIERKPLWVDGVWCNKPPWGSLVAVDLQRGEILWEAPIGRDENGVRGLFNIGPYLVTAGGLVIGGGAADQRLWVHDARTGDVVTSFELPAGLHAGAMTYKLRPDGKQYLVVAPGGHFNLGSKLGDYVIAYSLPGDEESSSEGQ